MWDERDVVVSKGGISTVFAGGAFFKLILLRRRSVIWFHFGCLLESYSRCVLIEGKFRSS